MPPRPPLRPVNPNNACHPRLTAAAGTRLAVACFAGTVKLYPLLTGKRSSLLKELYNPKAFFAHAASHRQAFAHCE